MPDLNALLRWSIANSASQTNPQEEIESSDPSATQLSLRFRPNTSPSQNSAAALHPSDPYYRRPITPQGIIDDISPASTPGPATPQPGETVFPNGGTGAAGPAASAARSDLTSEMLDLIMGKSDSMIMKEKMEIACDESRNVEERVEALDDFEMLIEMIDNANNMAILKLWEPIRNLLTSSNQDIIRHTAWICGTAVQNNLKAQAALYIHDIFPIILSLIYPPTPATPTPSTPTPTESISSTATRAKATYALSSALKHWPLASSALSQNSDRGYETLQRGVTDSEPIIRRKMAFLIGTLVLQSSEEYTGEIPNEVKNLIEEHQSSSSPSEPGDLLQGLKSAGILSSLLSELKTPREDLEIDVEFEENAIRALSSAYERGGLDEGEKRDVVGVWTKWGAQGREARGLSGEEGAEIDKIFRAA